jgi:hypothetical protein
MVEVVQGGCWATQAGGVPNNKDELSVKYRAWRSDLAPTATAILDLSAFIFVDVPCRGRVIG